MRFFSTALLLAIALPSAIGSDVPDDFEMPEVIAVNMADPHEDIVDHVEDNIAAEVEFDPNDIPAVIAVNEEAPPPRQQTSEVGPEVGAEAPLVDLPENIAINEEAPITTFPEEEAEAEAEAPLVDIPENIAINEEAPITTFPEEEAEAEAPLVDLPENIAINEEAPITTFPEEEGAQAPLVDLPENIAINEEALKEAPITTFPKGKPEQEPEVGAEAPIKELPEEEDSLVKEEWIRGCPVKQPMNGDVCHGALPVGGCKYNYKLNGCNENASCVPTDTFTCEKVGLGSYQWLHMSMDLVPCNDPNFSGTCDGPIFTLGNGADKPLLENCKNHPDPFVYHNNESITCHEVSAQRLKLRTKLCGSNQVVSDHCPGVCKPNNTCRCIDNPVTFALSRNRSTSCTELATMRKLDKKCKRKKIAGNCPTLCDETCAPVLIKEPIEKEGFLVKGF